jgi:thiamine-monophosphate kinase
MNESFENRLNNLAQSFNVPVKRIGTIKNGDLELMKHGKIIDYREKPFEHF